MSKLFFSGYRGEIAARLGLSSDDIQLETSTSSMEYSSKGEGYNYKVWLKKSETNDHSFILASFSLVPMIGCCGIIVSTAANVAYRFQNKGLGTLLNKIRIEMATDMGYGLLMCTDIVENVAQQRVLAKNNWESIHKFRNPRTNHEVSIHVINL